MKRLLVLAPIAGLLVMTGCGATFKAVDATGGLGKRIDGSVAQTAPAELCADMSALVPEPCPDTAGKWGDVADAMVAYASKLSALAARDDVDPDQAVTSALGAASQASWSKLDKDQNGAIAAFAGAVVNSLSMAYRAGVLDDVIARVDPHVQKVGALLEGEAVLRIQQIDALKGTAQSLLQMLPITSRPSYPVASPSPTVAAPSAPLPASEAKPDPMIVQWIRNHEAANQLSGQAAGLGLVVLLQDLDAKKRAYATLEASVAAFCAAHAELARNVGRLSADELLPRVIKVAKAAVELKNEFKGNAGGNAAAGN